MFTKNKEMKASRFINLDQVADGIIRMIKTPGELTYLISELNRRFRKSTKKACYENKKHKMVHMLCADESEKDPQEKYLAQMETQGFSRRPYENAKRTQMPELGMHDTDENKRKWRNGKK